MGNMGTRSMNYRIIHFPDGGDPRLLSMFLCAGDAWKYARDLIADQNNNIREIALEERRGRSWKVARRWGWAVDAA